MEGCCKHPSLTPCHLLVGACILFFCCTPVSYARNVELLDDDLLIVAAKIGRLQISDDLFVYYQPDFTLIPLQAFCDSLDFVIEVDAEAQSATGWFIDEARTFNLNLQDNSLYIAGKKIEIPASTVIARDDFDLYIDIDALKQWFGLQLELQTSQLVLDIASKDPLPIQQKLAREQNRKDSDGPSVEADQSADIENHYQLVTPPVVDAQFVYSHDKTIVDTTDPSNSPSMTLPSTNEPSTELVAGSSFAYNIEASADLLYHQMSLSINADDASDYDTIRFALSRRARDFDQTIFMGMTEYSAGDVFTSGDSLINKGSSGVGLTFQRNFDGGHEPNFTQKLIEGDAPPGWEVELYRNGSLIDFQVSGDNGRYRFENVTLNFGENVFDIKIYGPQGQERSRRERVNVGRNMIKPGAWTYRGALMKEKDVLFGDTPPTQSEPDNGFFTLEYGLNDSHSIGFGMSQSAPSRSGAAHSYVNASLLSAWSFLSTGLELVNDSDGGNAYQLAASTRLGDQQLNLEYRGYQDFVSQYNPNGIIKTQSDFNWSTYLPVSKDNGLPINLGIEQTQFIDGTDRLLAKALVSGQWRALRFTNELNWDQQSNYEDSSRGSLNINFIHGRWRSRSNLVYNLRPVSELRRLTTTIDWQGSQWRCQFNIDAGIHEDELDAFGFNISRRTLFGSLSMSARRDENGVTTAQMSMEFSIGTKKQNPWYFTSPSSLADKGRARVQVYLDNDNNDQFDSDIDEPLAGVTFLGRKEWSHFTTDKNGLVELAGFNSFANSSISLEEKSLNDPYLRPKKPSLRVSHHGGGYYELQFPIRLITDVEGYVYLNKNGERTAASGVTLYLLDEAGKTVQTVKTEFDGYYYFTGLPQGQYQLSLDKRIQSNADYTVNTPMLVDAEGTEGIVELEDVVINRTNLGVGAL